MKDTKKCKVCGKFFEKPYTESKKSWKYRHKYCSTKCSRENTCFKKGQIPHNKGKKRWWKSSGEFKKGQIAPMKGRKRPDWTGAKNNKWRGGTSSENDKIRHSIEYRLWSSAVMARDSFTCQKTGIIGYKLVVHHIKNFSDYPELRFAIDNGITFSLESHRLFHKIYGVKNNNKGQVDEFILLK